MAWIAIVCPTHGVSWMNVDTYRTFITNDINQFFSVFHMKSVFSSFFPIFFFFFFCSFFHHSSISNTALHTSCIIVFCYDVVWLASVSSGVHCYIVSHFSLEKKAKNNSSFISIVVRFRIHFISYITYIVSFAVCWMALRPTSYSSAPFSYFVPFHSVFFFFYSLLLSCYSLRQNNSSERWMVVFFCWFVFMGQ